MCLPIFFFWSLSSWGQLHPLEVTKVRSKRRLNATQCLDKAMHARDMHDSKRVGEPSDGDGEGLRMGESTLSKAALCSISFPFLAQGGGGCL